jgi:hypothetical protein
MEAKPLISVIEEYKQLTVDDYQRTYAWDKDQIDEFFADLRETAATGDTHFFGTLILQSSGQGRASVVDGQQRLTTTYLTIAAFRDAVTKLDSEEIRDHGRIPVNVATEAWEFLVADRNPNVPRFTSNRFLIPLIQRIVLPLPEAQDSIPERDTQLTLKFRKAIKHIRELVRLELEDIAGDEAKLRHIHSLQESLLKKFLVLHVTTSNMNESLEIFLTLNNRGLPLGPSDLVRGEVMSAMSMALSDAEQKRLHTRIFEEWGTISENVEDPEVFLRHYLVATGKAKVTKKKVVENVSKRIRTEAGDRSAALADTFWRDLIQSSEIYSKIISAGNETATGYYLNVLHGFMKSHRIFMIGLYRSEGSEADVNEAVRLLYILCFRYVMAGQNAQKLEDFFQVCCNEMRNGAPLSEIHKALIEKNEEFELNVEKYLRLEGDSSFIGKAILHGINRKEAPRANNANTIGSNIHLEHIAPKTDTPEWKADLFSGQTELYDDYENVVSQIGNLTLLDAKLNTEAQQSSMSIKKNIYHQSNFQITRDLDEIGTWRLEDVERRTTWVAEMFTILWNVDASFPGFAKYIEWSGPAK